jgi:hypothetical protein
LQVDIGVNEALRWQEAEFDRLKNTDLNSTDSSFLISRKIYHISVTNISRLIVFVETISLSPEATQKYRLDLLNSVW